MHQCRIIELRARIPWLGMWIGNRIRLKMPEITKAASDGLSCLYLPILLKCLHGQYLARRGCGRFECMCRQAVHIDWSDMWMQMLIRAPEFFCHLFLLAGMIGIVFSSQRLTLSADGPESYRWISSGERHYILQSRAAKSNKHSKPATLLTANRGFDSPHFSWACLGFHCRSILILWHSTRRSLSQARPRCKHPTFVSVAHHSTKYLLVDSGNNSRNANSLGL